MTRSTGKRAFHFKNTLPKDPAIQPFGEWSQANRGFYDRFRRWLRQGGYGASALNIYSVAARMAIGLLKKPYWQIDPESDLALIKVHIRERFSSSTTRSGYEKGLRKFVEYLDRQHGREKPKEIHWETYIGPLSRQLQEDVREFIRWKQCFWKDEQRFERTLSVLSHLTLSLRWMAEHGLRDIAALTPQLWYAYLDQRLAGGISPKTVNGEISSLKGMVFFFRDHERPVCERFLLVDTLEEGDDLPRDIPLDSLRRLEQAIRTEAASTHAGRRRTGRMDLAWFLLMLHSGLRTAEVRNLKPKHIEWDAHRLRIEQSKGLKDRLVYASEAALAALRDYLEARGPGDVLPENIFVYFHRPLSKTYCFERLGWYGRHAGVHATPHQLRHSCATLLLNAGTPVVTVQAILGHKNVDTTLGYARLYDGTVAADYYRAMTTVERQLALPEDRLAQPPSLGELLALVDSLRNGALNPAQTEIVWTLRSGLALLADQITTMGDVKVLRIEQNAMHVPQEAL
jgi:site-specific recombinase XerD